MRTAGSGILGFVGLEAGGLQAAGLDAGGLGSVAGRLGAPPLIPGACRGAPEPGGRPLGKRFDWAAARAAKRAARREARAASLRAGSAATCEIRSYPMQPPDHVAPVAAAHVAAPSGTAAPVAAAPVAAAHVAAAPGAAAPVAVAHVAAAHVAAAHVAVAHVAAAHVAAAHVAVAPVAVAPVAVQSGAAAPVAVAPGALASPAPAPAEPSTPLGKRFDWAAARAAKRAARREARAASLRAGSAATCEIRSYPMQPPDHVAPVAAAPVAPRSAAAQSGAAAPVSTVWRAAPGAAQSGAAASGAAQSGAAAPVAAAPGALASAAPAPAEPSTGRPCWPSLDPALDPGVSPNGDRQDRPVARSAMRAAKRAARRAAKRLARASPTVGTGSTSRNTQLPHATGRRIGRNPAGARRAVGAGGAPDPGGTGTREKRSRRCSSRMTWRLASPAGAHPRRKGAATRGTSALGRASVRSSRRRPAQGRRGMHASRLSGVVLWSSFMLSGMRTALPRFAGLGREERTKARARAFVPGACPRALVPGVAERSLRRSRSCASQDPHPSRFARRPLPRAAGEVNGFQVGVEMF